MGNEKVGFFKQFAYAFRGIVKPKYFNRMASQNVFCMIIFVLFINLLSTAILWGFHYLSLITSDQIKSFADQFPEFQYSYGQLVIPGDDFVFEDEARGRVFSADTSVEDAYNCSLYAVKTKAGWGNGKEIYVFTGNALIGFDKVNGKETYYSYTDFYNLFSKIFKIPQEFSNKDLRSIINSNIWRGVLIVAAVAYIINVFFSFTFIPLILAGIGFGLNKLLHGDYRFKELYKVGVYIFCMATLLVTPFKLTFLPGKMITWFSYILMLVYLYFALTGSRIEVGNASSIELGKKEPKFDDDFGFRGGGFAAPDPLENRKPVSPYYSSSSSASASSSYVQQPSSAPTVMVAEVPTPNKPVIEEPTYEEAVYQEQSYEEPVYEEPVYQESAYQEPVYEEAVYQESAYQEPVYEEPVYQESAYQEPVYEEPVYQEPVYEEPVYEEPAQSNSSMSSNIISISGGIGGVGGSSYRNSGGSYAGTANTGGGIAVARSGSNIGGYHDPAYDMPQSFESEFSSEPLPRLNESYGGTFSVNDFSGPAIGGSTFAASSQSSFGGSAIGGSTFGSTIGGSTFGSSSFGGSSFGSSSYGGGSNGSAYGANRFSRPKDEPLLRSSGSGSQADKDFEEWERQHYGNN